MTQHGTAGRRASVWSLGWRSLPLLVLTAATFALYAVGSPASHESGTLLFAANLLLTTLVSAFIAVLAGRSYLASGRAPLLAICVGMIVWGFSALVAVIGEHLGNYNLTIHNLGVLLSGICHLAGTQAARRRGREHAHSPGASLALGVAFGLIVVGLIRTATAEAWLPPFFVEGEGATPLRTAVLSASIVIYAIAAASTGAHYRDTGWRFLRWYALGLAAIAVGCVGLMLQPISGSWLGWVARSTQYLGGLYMLVGALVTMKETGSWQFSLQDRLLRSERQLRDHMELIRHVNDNTSELIFMKDRSGRLTYANAATLRMIGATASAIGASDTEFFRVATEQASISDNDRQVMDTGQVLEVEEVYTGPDGTRRVLASTKTPIRDETGTVIGVIGVSRDITERKQQEEALRDADRRKDEFIATLAHELRNPLSAIRTGLTLLELPRVDAVISGKVTAMMKRQMEQLVHLIDDLLDVSRVSHGKLELRKGRVELGAVIRDALEATQPLFDAAGHALDVTLPSVDVYLLADPVRLSQIVGNLLSNACKFTEGNGRISLTAECRDDVAVVTVRDNGIGIAPEDMRRIFEPFSQADTTLEKSQGGLGIGLTLVKRLVDMHGGTIEVHSEGRNRGSEFVVRLPVTAEAAAPCTYEPAKPLPRAGHRILVVDDNRDSAESLALLLALTGNETHTAHDGEEGVEAAARLMPDMIVLDIGMPKLNGYDACRAIRAQPGGENVVIVAASGLGQDEDKRKSNEAGFDAHLVKPIDAAALLALARPRIGPNRALQARAPDAQARAAPLPP